MEELQAATWVCVIEKVLCENDRVRALEKTALELQDLVSQRNARIAELELEVVKLKMQNKIACENCISVDKPEKSSASVANCDKTIISKNSNRVGIENRNIVDHYQSSVFDEQFKVAEIENSLEFFEGIDKIPDDKLDWLKSSPIDNEVFEEVLAEVGNNLSSGDLTTLPNDLPDCAKNCVILASEIEDNLQIATQHSAKLRGILKPTVDFEPSAACKPGAVSKRNDVQDPSEISDPNVLFKINPNSAINSILKRKTTCSTLNYSMQRYSIKIKRRIKKLPKRTVSENVTKVSKQDQLQKPQILKKTDVQANSEQNDAQGLRSECRRRVNWLPGLKKRITVYKKRIAALKSSRVTGSSKSTQPEFFSSTRFQCDKCDKSFLSRIKMLEHKWEKHMSQVRVDVSASQRQAAEDKQTKLLCKRPKRAHIVPKRFKDTIDYTKIPLKSLVQSSKNTLKSSNLAKVQTSHEFAKCNDKSVSKELVTQHKTKNRMPQHCIKPLQKQHVQKKGIKFVAKPNAGRKTGEKQKHSRNFKRRGYHCLCGRPPFTTLQHLTKHIKYFTLEKQFDCCECSRRFVGANYLRQHYVLAHGAKPGTVPVYGCRSCGAICKSYKELWVHRKEFHRKSVNT